MPFEDNHINHLNDIIELIKANKITGINEALERFNTYLDTVQTIGLFDINNWRQDWRQKVWKLGTEFQTLNPHRFLQIIDTKLNLPTTANKEVIEFIRSEIAFNFLPDKECKKQLEILIEKYPLNSEFRHTLGHYYARENELLKSIQEYKLALRVEPTNYAYAKSRFASEYKYLNKLISEGKYSIGQEYVQSIYAEKFYINFDSNYYNSFVDFQTRFSDHLIFQSKLQQLEKDFKDKMSSELDSERKHIIEILGFFSAVVAFILSTVSIGKNFSFIEATYFIIALGIILILFVVALSTLFSSNKIILYKDKRFWILIISLIVLLLFILETDSISKIIERLKN